MVVEHGGGGSRTAAPIARRLIDYYFRDAVVAKDATRAPSSVGIGNESLDHAHGPEPTPGPATDAAATSTTTLPNAGTAATPAAAAAAAGASAGACRAPRASPTMIRTPPLLYRLHIDAPLLGGVLVMAALGLVVLYSAAYSYRSTSSSNRPCASCSA